MVRKAAEVRVQEHRLQPSLRLRTKDEVVRFVHDRELVSFLGGSELPSLVSAVLGRQWKPSRKGFTGWLDWWSVKVSGQRVAEVSRELEGRDDILSARLFRGTKTFVSDDVWAALDPIVKYHRELAKKGDILSDLERRVLERVKNENSIRTDRLRKRLGLGSKENNYKFHRALVNLEKYLLIVGVEDPVPEKHLHANIWQTWQDRTRKRTGKASLTYREALAELVKKTLDSCVLAREDQIGRWFHWHADVGAIVQELLRKEAILKAGSYLLTSRISAS